MKKALLPLLLTVLLLIPLRPMVAWAYSRTNPAPGYDPNNLINDIQFTGYGFTDDQTINFLHLEGSWLQNYTIPGTQSVFYQYKDPNTGNCVGAYMDVPQVYNEYGNNENFGGLSAGALISQQAHKYGINPQVVLATLEKESNAITSATEKNAINTAWILGVGWNDTMATCQYTQAQAQSQAYNWGGIGQQIAYAAHYVLKTWYTYYQQNPTLVPSINWSFTDSTPFTLQTSSIATKALYKYTPYVYDGNYNFWHLFSTWFGSTPPSPYLPPLVMNNGMVYVADQNKLWHITSPDAFNAYGFDWNSIVPLTGSAYQSYPIAGDISRLIRDSGGHVYYIEAGKRRPVQSARIFLLKGFNWSDVTPIDDQIINKIAVGTPLFELVRIAGTGSVYFQSYGENHHIESADVFSGGWNFDWNEVVDVPGYEVYQFPATRDLSRLALSDDSHVYLIDGGNRYLIPSADLFQQFGFSWDKVVKVGDALLNQKTAGSPLTSLIGSSDGKVYFVSNGKKQYVSYSVFMAHHFSFGDVRWLTDGMVSSIPTGTNL